MPIFKSTKIKIIIKFRLGLVFHPDQLGCGPEPMQPCKICRLRGNLSLQGLWESRIMLLMCSDNLFYMLNLVWLFNEPILKL